MNTNIQGDFQIFISVPFIEVPQTENKTQQFVRLKHIMHLHIKILYKLFQYITS